MEKSTGFLRRAWHDLTNEAGWWKPVVILALVSLIPIVGPMFVAGYLLDWAREGAWGMSRGLPRKAGDTGKRLKWGFFAAVISLVWTLPAAIIAAVLHVVPYIGITLFILCQAISIVLGVVAQAGNVRMAIYDRLNGGLQFKRLWSMACEDIGGLARCFCIGLLQLIPILVSALIVLATLAPLLIILFGAADASISSNSMLYAPSYHSYGGSGDLGSPALFAALGFGLVGLLVITVVGVFAAFFLVLLKALECRAYGYWIGQFQPSKWGTMDAPMPHEPGYAAASREYDLS